MKSTLYSILFWVMPIWGLAQKHDYNWIWGWGYEHNGDPKFGNTMINFQNKKPVMFKNEKRTNFTFYGAMCSDSSGKEIFHSNGINIKNAAGKIMANGDSINPGEIWEKWKKNGYPNGPFCYALPAPGKPNTYCFFHIAVQLDTKTNTYESAPLYYSLIDMNGNFGQGAVIEKNQVLIPEGDLVAPVAVKHGNGRDWWFITGILGTAQIHTFLLSEKGVQGPFVQKLWDGTGKREYQSMNTMSPDGRTYVRCDGLHGLQVYDFDRCSGKFGNLRVIPFADDLFVFASAFAPDSKTLYFSNFEYMMSIDLSASDPSATFDTLAYFDGKASPREPFITGFWTPSLAPDGKIYYATTNGTLSMHIIHAPGQPGQAADVEQHGLDLLTFNSGTMCQFPNYRLGEWVGSPCDTLQVQSPPLGFMRPPYLPSDAARNHAKERGVTFLRPIGGKTPNTELPERRIPSMAEMALAHSAAAQQKQAEETKQGKKEK